MMSGPYITEDRKLGAYATPTVVEVIGNGPVARQFAEILAAFSWSLARNGYPRPWGTVSRETKAALKVIARHPLLVILRESKP
jgi:hypothetical protein